MFTPNSITKIFIYRILKLPSLEFERKFSSFFLKILKKYFLFNKIFLLRFTMILKHSNNKLLLKNFLSSHFSHFYFIHVNIELRSVRQITVKNRSKLILISVAARRLLLCGCCWTCFLINGNYNVIIYHT